MSANRKRWLVWAGVVFAAQLALFAYIHFFMVGAPHWAEIPYEPFQSLLMNVLGQFWPIGLWLGVIIGTLVYSTIFGCVFAWAFRKKAL